MSAQPDTSPAPSRGQEATASIELLGVSKWYESRGSAAVDDLSLCITAGEFFSLLGPSGCGKSTTLRIMAGFEHPDSGVVRLGGVDVTGVAPNHRDVNMVFQNYALFPHLSVFDNIAYGLRRKHLPGAEVTRRVGEMAEVTELDALTTRKPRALSGGQQQRVALARALVNRPGALLLDEPLGALDLKLRQSMQGELKRIQRDVGITFVYVTHDQGEALVMSDRIAVMNEGSIQQLAPPDVIYQRPKNRFVADFIGSSNIVSGTVVEFVDQMGVLDMGVSGQVRLPARDGLVRAGEQAHLTIRPERVQLIPRNRPHQSGCWLNGHIEEISFLGTFTSYLVRTATGDGLLVHRQNSTQHDFTPVIGEAATVLWSPEDSHALR